MTQLLGALRAFQGIVELAPGPGSDTPEIAWGDHFFYFSPDGKVPDGQQPYATVVTKDYPGDAQSDLDGHDRWRLNVQVTPEQFVALTGEEPSAEPAQRAYDEADVVLPHPVYRAQGWVAVVNPGPRTTSLVGDLLREAHTAAERRYRRRLEARADPQ